MSKEQNLATQEKAAEHLNAGEIDLGVDALFAEDAVDHDPADGQPPGREGIRGYFRALTAAFPDANLEARTVVADGEHVAFAYNLTGTHRGVFRGIAPTGRRIRVRGMQIGKFADGRIVERWGSSDELGIMRQLGAEVG